MKTKDPPLIGPQERTLDALRELLDRTGAIYRLDRGPTSPLGAAVYELRLGGMHWGFVAINDDGSLDLI